MSETPFTRVSAQTQMKWNDTLFFVVFFFFSFPSEAFSLWVSQRCEGRAPDPRELVVFRASSAAAAALGGPLLCCWQQALLRQVSLERVEDVELLVHAEGQELLDHLGGVGAPARRRVG